MTGNGFIHGFDPSQLIVDHYGHPVDYEALFSISLSGLLALSRKLQGPPALDLELWRVGSDRVASARASMETAFRKLGDDLERLLAANAEGVRLARASIAAGMATDTGNDTNSLVNAARLSQRALRFNEHSKAQAAEVAAFLADLERMSREIHQMVNQIQEHMRPAEVVQVLLRIECARLDEVARAPLEALSAEIARACMKMESTMDVEFALVKQTHATVSNMVEHLRNLNQRQADGEQRRSELSQEMELLHLQATEQIERDQALFSISAQLDQAVGKVIESMQFQDIVGQRWQHVEEGLRRVADGNPAKAETGWDAMLQQRQLAEANAEMAEALCRIEDCLQLLQGAEATLVAQIDGSMGSAERKNLYVRLHAVLFEVWDMARTNQDEMQMIDQLILPLVDVAGKMGCQIGSVSHEMRIIALNSQIQAARFGAGTGLEVLAEGLRQIADRMGESGAALDRDSREIELIAQSLRSAFHELGEQSVQVCRECDHDFPMAIEALDQEEKKVNGLLREASASLANMARVREQMLDSLRHAATPLEDLAVLAQDCGNFVEKHYESDERVKALRAESVLAAESARYTMESEKAVLRQLAGAESGFEENKPATGELDLF